jgi:predicted O-methyltransferase YrrM
MQGPWTPEKVLDMTRGFQPACVIAAGAELDVFTVLAKGPLDAEEVARKVDADPRGTAVLLDALAALGLLEKRGEAYGLAPGVGDILAEGGSASALAMIRHQGNCLRRWGQLASVVETGAPAELPPSVRGEEADLASFIGAMDEISRASADALVATLEPRRFRHILDVGGASGTWTIAFLRAAPLARATLFDRPEVMPLARKRLAEAGVLDRVHLAPGDFSIDPLPGGADLVWLSAIVHQNSREENRGLFRKSREALLDDGLVAVRDIVMEPDRTRPPMGALFAVNMLVATEGGGTFTFEELAEDLRASGFTDATLARKAETMDSIVTARKAPGAAGGA